MALVNLSQAARLAGISRTHLYKRYIEPGKISIDRSDPKAPMVDTSELLRIFGTLAEHTYEDSSGSVRVQEFTSTEYNQNRPLQPEVIVLREQLQAAREQLRTEQERALALERAAQDRERWLQGQVDKLTDTVRLLEHRAEPHQDQQRPGFFRRLFGGAK
jgi:hypothetical protein